MRDTLFELLGNVLSDELSVHVGIADLDDVELDLLADHLFHSQTILLDLLAALADDHARPGAVEEDGDDFVAPLDLDLGNTGAVQGLLQVIADLLVLDQQVAHQLVLGVPTGVPILDDTHAQAVGIYFLSHKTVLLPLMPFPSQPG